MRTLLRKTRLWKKDCYFGLDKNNELIEASVLWRNQREIGISEKKRKLVRLRAMATSINEVLAVVGVWRAGRWFIFDWLCGLASLVYTFFVQMDRITNILSEARWLMFKRSLRTDQGREMRKQEKEGRRENIYRGGEESVLNFENRLDALFVCLLTVLFFAPSCLLIFHCSQEKNDWLSRLQLLFGRHIGIWHVESNKSLICRQQIWGRKVYVWNGCVGEEWVFGWFSNERALRTF